MAENLYHVEQVHEVTILDEARNPVAGYRVFFTWGIGRKGHVDIPKDRATKEVRDSLIEAEIIRQETLWS